MLAGESFDFYRHEDDWSMRERQRQGDEETRRPWRSWTLIYWPLSSSSSHCAILIALLSTLLTTLSHTQIQGHMSFLLWHNILKWSLPGCLSGTSQLTAADCYCCGLPLRLSVTDWIFSGGKIERLTITVWVPVYILFHNSMHFQFNPCELLKPMHHCFPVYIGVSNNHSVYTAGTSGSVKGQYATPIKYILLKFSVH